MRKVLPLLLLCFVMAGCAKKVAAPVPGTINSFDAYSARVIGDAQEAILSTKAWEFCSDQNWPVTVTIDNQIRACDNSAGPFPKVGRQILYTAEKSYNVARDAALAYHNGASQDTAGLTQSLTQLGIDIGNLLAGIGKGH